MLLTVIRTTCIINESNLKISFPSHEIERIPNSEYHQGGYSLNIYTHETHFVYGGYNQQVQMKNGNFISRFICQYTPQDTKPVEWKPVTFPKMNDDWHIHTQTNSNEPRTEEGKRFQDNLVICPESHLVWNFMSFDSKSRCKVELEMKSMFSIYNLNDTFGSIWKKPAMFQCEIGKTNIKFALRKC